MFAGVGDTAGDEHGRRRIVHAAKLWRGVTSPALAVLLICLGLTLPAVAYPISQARRRRWEARSFAALEPLWTDLTATMPEIVLSPAGLSKDVAADSDFLLQRRVIEISDGILALRPYRSRRVQETAQERVDLATRGGAAFVEAVVLRTALESLRSGHRPGEAAEPSVAGTSSQSGDLREETEWLLAVADAYAQA